MFGVSLENQFHFWDGNSSYLIATRKYYTVCRWSDNHWLLHKSLDGYHAFFASSVKKSARYCCFRAIIVVCNHHYDVKVNYSNKRNIRNLKCCDELQVIFKINQENGASYTNGHHIQISEYCKCSYLLVSAEANVFYQA